MVVVPAHDDLNDPMKSVERDIGRNDEPAPDTGMRIFERDFQEIGTWHEKTLQRMKEWKTLILPDSSSQGNPTAAIIDIGSTRE